MPEYEQRTLLDGEQRLYTFLNGYGASVVRLCTGLYGGSYGSSAGLWELAVTHGGNHNLCYATPITDDVIGWLTLAQVEYILDDISELPPRSDCSHQRKDSYE